MSEETTTVERVSAQGWEIEVDPKSPELQEHLSKGVTRAKEISNQYPSLSQAEALMIYITKEHPQFSQFYRTFEFTTDGQLEANPNDPTEEELQRDYKVADYIHEKGKVSLDAICEFGDQCFGQSVFASACLEKMGCPNTILHLAPKEKGDHHAMIIYHDTEKNIDQIFDPMFGIVLPQQHFKVLYGDEELGVLDFKGEIKRPDEIFGV